jgi:hypothetical protein
MALIELARKYTAVGLSVIPIVPDGSNKPDIPRVEGISKPSTNRGGS